MIPTRRILDPIFGKPILRAANNGRAAWTRVNELSQWQKGTGWQANLYGGVQTGDDWGGMFVPVSELRVTDFNAALWSYYITQAQTFGVNLVIWVHDPNDFSKRAEITQLASIAGLGKAAKWNSHTLDKTTDQFFFFGEGTTGTGLTAGPPNYYGWDDFQADALFKTWHIYRVSLEYGWEASGTFDHVWVVELKLNGMQIPIKPDAPVITKTIQTELLAITKVAANAQQKSSELDLANMKKATIFIDHGRTATTAFVVAGTEYRIEASQKETGNDTWRTIASVEGIITAASEITADGAEAAGQTVIECGDPDPEIGDIVFWENATLANSEWGKVVAHVDNTSFTLQDGLTNAQANAKKIYNKGEQFVLTLDVTAFTRLRVVVNNNNGTTNAQVASRVAAITQE